MVNLILDPFQALFDPNASNNVFLKILIKIISSLYNIITLYEKSEKYLVSIFP